MNLRRLLALTASLLLVQSCLLVTHSIKTGGEQQLVKVAPPPAESGPHVIIFALDGAVPEQLMQAIHSGHAPNIARLLGKDEGHGLFEHAYAAPNALSVLPSSTIADWSSIFTGKAPAQDGVTGDEWFDRETARFYAPVHVSLTDIADNTKTVADDLVGKELKAPTLYELLGRRSYVSMLSVHRGATYYTTVPPSAFGDLIEHLVKGTLKGHQPERSLSGSIDRDATKNAIETIEKHGVPDLQVIYFPGIDIFTHAAENPLESQVRYLELVTDPTVGAVLDEYAKKNVLDHTYVIFISDHAHIPTINDESHELGTDEKGSPFAAVAKARFRVRRPSLLLPNRDKDYQAVLAYQGFMAYIYLADRSTCPKDGQHCDWKKPPRFEEDVVPVLEAFYRSNRYGRPVRDLKGKIDLIFARQPVAAGEDALPYEIFDGEDLVRIDDYLIDHPRPELVHLNERIRWLSAGPYGNRAGDILLLPRACMNLPIQQRYYFAAITHYSWHGSACEQDSHIPFILAQEGGSGRRMRSILRRFGGDSPSEKELTPLVRLLFSDSIPAPSKPGK
jgi:Type I phosphodiesterase / nucleotide pyrophosphatase